MASKFKVFLCFVVLSLMLLSPAFARKVVINPAKSPNPVTAYEPAAMTDSVYKIVALQDGEGQWSGTAWKIAEGFMVTAGHVCDPEGEDGITFRVISKWNKEYPVEVEKFSREPDLCLLSAPHVPGPSLNKQGEMPWYGDTVWYSGAPYGVFGDGIVPFAEGVYIGNGHMMIAGYPGASGSPVYTRAGVVGVLVAGYTDTHITIFVPAYVLYAWLKE